MAGRGRAGNAGIVGAIFPAAAIGDINVTANGAIDARFMPVLDDVAQVLQQYDQSTIDVLGYTDSSGGDAINQPLSDRRASSVASELVRRGVIAQRIYVAGMSSQNPVASNATPEGRAMNRRVEILIRPFRG